MSQRNDIIIGCAQEHQSLNNSLDADVFLKNRNPFTDPRRDVGRCAPSKPRVEDDEGEGEHGEGKGDESVQLRDIGAKKN